MSFRFCHKKGGINTGDQEFEKISANRPTINKTERN